MREARVHEPSFPSFLRVNLAQRRRRRSTMTTPAIASDALKKAAVLEDGGTLQLQPPPGMTSWLSCGMGNGLPPASRPASTASPQPRKFACEGQRPGHSMLTLVPAGHSSAPLISQKRVFFSKVRPSSFERPTMKPYFSFEHAQRPSLARERHWISML